MAFVGRKMFIPLVRHLGRLCHLATSSRNGMDGMWLSTYPCAPLLRYLEAAAPDWVFEGAEPTLSSEHPYLKTCLV